MCGLPQQLYEKIPDRPNCIYLSKWFFQWKQVCRMLSTKKLQADQNFRNLWILKLGLPQYLYEKVPDKPNYYIIFLSTWSYQWKTCLPDSYYLKNFRQTKIFGTYEYFLMMLAKNAAVVQRKTLVLVCSSIESFVWI